MDTGSKIAQVATLIDDPARANVLSALMDGRTLTASELACLSGVAERYSDTRARATITWPAASPSQSPIGWSNSRLFCSMTMADNSPMLGPGERNRKDPICFSPYPYRSRNSIERFFNKVKQCRHVATRYDRLAANYLAFVKLASIRIWLRADEFTPWRGCHTAISLRSLLAFSGL